MLLLPLLALSCGDGVYKEYEIDLGNKVDSVTVKGVKFSKSDDAKDAYYKFLDKFDDFDSRNFNSSSYFKSKSKDEVITTNGYYYSNSTQYYGDVELERGSVKLRREEFEDLNRDFTKISEGDDKKWVDCYDDRGEETINYGTDERLPKDSNYQFYLNDVGVFLFCPTTRFNSSTEDLVIHIGVNNDVLDLNPYYSFSMEVYSNYVHFNVHNSIGVSHFINDKTRIMQESAFYSYLLSSINSKDNSMDQDIYLNTKTGVVDKISYNLIGLDPILHINDQIELRVQAMISDRNPNSEISALITECESYKK